MSKIITPGHPDFYINKRNYKELEVHLGVGVKGFFSGRAIKDGHVMREFGYETPNPNLITNLGMDAFGSSNINFSRMHLGTGTATPAFTDTALTTFGTNVVAGNPSNSVSNSGSPDYYTRALWTWTSAVGGATGNWTEIGISNQNTTGNLRSHALILDGGGSPTTFPVLADEQFQGTYELRFYQNLTDNVQTGVMISGVPYTTTARGLYVQNSPANSLFSGANPLYPGATAGAWYTGALGASTASVPGGSYVSGAATRTISSYTSGNHYIDAQERWGSGSAVGTLRTLQLQSANSGNFQWQVEYNPTIVKLTTEELILNHRRSWARR